MTSPGTFGGACKKDECLYKETGRCLEGLEATKCPNFSAASLDPGTPTSPGGDVPLAPKTLPLPFGGDLPFTEAGSLLASSHTRVIVIAGENDAGKTTLVASVFQRLCRGPFEGFSFAGSKSLAALDERMYLGQTRCAASSADTARTAHNFELRFLHVRLREMAGDKLVPACDILFSDLPGETCKRARDSASECSKLVNLRRADRLMIVVDGAKLASPARRASTTTAAVALLRRLIESGVLSPGVPIDVVATKWDLVRATNSETDARTAISRMKDQVSAATGSRHSVLWHEIAARPEDVQVLPHCFGMDAFPRLWCHLGPAPSLERTPFAQSPERDMDRYIADGGVVQA